MTRSRTLLSLVLVPLLVFLVACGGDDDDGGDSGSSSEPSASDSSGSGSSGSSSGSSDSSGSSSSGSSDSSSSDSSGDSDADAEAILENCPELMASFGAFGAAFSGTSSEDVEFDEIVALFQEAADNAPDEIRGDMQILATAFSDFYGALEEMNVDLSNPASFATLSAEDQARLQEMLSSLDTPELQEASENLDAYFTEKCS